MKKAYKYRIYPTEEQKKFFELNFNAARWFWNYALNHINTHYQENKDNADCQKKHLSAQYDVIKDLVQLKKEEQTKWLKDADSTLYGYVGNSLDTAFKCFFNKNKKQPKFKSKSYEGSYTTNNIGHKTIFIKNDKLTVLKCKSIKIIIHQPFFGTIQRVTISKKGYDFYEASILVENDAAEEMLQTPTIETTVGIDMGIKNEVNAATSDGKVYETISVDREIKHLKHLQKLFSRKKKLPTGNMVFSRKYGKEIEEKKPSKNYIKLQQKIAKLHDKIKRKRNYATHLISSDIAKDESIKTICVEDLNVKGMAKNHHLANSVSNANMGELRTQLEYKARWNGKNFVKIDRFYPSSQNCSCCGYRNTKLKNTNIHEWTCPNCGTHHHRDINAAINIRDEGYRTLTEQRQNIKK